MNEVANAPFLFQMLGMSAIYMWLLTAASVMEVISLALILVAIILRHSDGRDSYRPSTPNFTTPELELTTYNTTMYDHN